MQIHVAQECLIRKVVVGYTSHIPATHLLWWIDVCFFLFLYRTNKTMYRNPKHPNIVHQSEMNQYIHVREMYDKIDKLWWGTLHSYGFSPKNKTVIDSRDCYFVCFCCIFLLHFRKHLPPITDLIVVPHLWYQWSLTTMAAATWGWRGWPIASVDWDKAGKAVDAKLEVARYIGLGYGNICWDMVVISDG